jgi:hypothetical protein
LEQDIGERGRRYMKKSKVKYTNEPIGKIKVVPDFLPRPSELVAKEETVKVTLLLTKESVDFFKQEAEEQHTQYQKMIRALIDLYAQNYNKPQKKRKYG